MKTRILIIGGSSLLGKYLLATVPQDFEVYSTYYMNKCRTDMIRMNLLDALSIKEVFKKIRPNIVIMSAGCTSVEFVEKNYEHAYNLNLLGTGKVLDCVGKLRCPFYYISTNAVYDGDNAPYSEFSKRNPINKYGKLAKEVEDMVRHYPLTTMIRLHLMYGWPFAGGRQNWVTIAIEKLKNNETLEIVNDKITQPLYALDAANFIWQRINYWTMEEIYNLAGPDSLSLYNYVKMIAEIWGYSSDLIKPIESGDKFVPRPNDTSYVLRNVIGSRFYPMSLFDGLNHMKEERELI